MPIVLLSDELTEQIFGVKPKRKIKAPYWAGNRETPDPYELFDLTCVDAIAHDGREVVADLNYPHDLGEFDLVIDAGTTEHCFNVGQAIVNAANAVKVGGYILHTNPVSMGNHGFYNFNPTLFYDFYVENGFKLVGLEIRDRCGEGNAEKYDLTARFPLGNNWAMYCMARREKKTSLVMPVQAKYK